MSDPKQAQPARKPPAKRRTRRKEARPQEIVEAAMRLWAVKGFAGTRLDDVAAEAGVAKGTIYLYFASKEALFEAALRQTLVATMDATGAEMDHFDGDTEALLALFFRKVWRQLLETGSIVLMKILIGEGHRFPALVDLHREIALSRGMETIGSILQRGVARGELRPEATATDPRIIIGPVMTAALWSLVYAETVFPPFETLAAQHAAIVTRGLARD